MLKRTKIKNMLFKKNNKTVGRYGIGMLLGGLSFLASSAYAQGGGGAAEGAAGGLVSVLPMLLILVGCMYFMVIRPQRRKQQEQQKLTNNLKVGDEVVTIGGFLATIVKINNKYLTLQLGLDNKQGNNHSNNSGQLMQVLIQKNAIAQVLPKGTIEHVK